MAHVVIGDNCKKDIARESERLAITQGQAIERRWFGYPEKEKIAEEERIALIKQINTEKERYRLIEMEVSAITKKMFEQEIKIDCNEIINRSLNETVKTVETTTGKEDSAK